MSGCKSSGTSAHTFFYCGKGSLSLSFFPLFFFFLIFFLSESVFSLAVCIHTNGMTEISKDNQCEVVVVHCNLAVVSFPSTISTATEKSLHVASRDKLFGLLLKPKKKSGFVLFAMSSTSTSMVSYVGWN